jgi:hypothetical protein
VNPRLLVLACPFTDRFYQTLLGNEKHENKKKKKRGKDEDEIANHVMIIRLAKFSQL